MKLRYMVYFLIFCVFSSYTMVSTAIVENSQQSIKDCEKRLDDLNHHVDYSFVYEEKEGAEIEALDKEALLKSAYALLKDIEALMQRYPEANLTLDEALGKKYRASYDKKCSKVFGKYTKKQHPEMRFYNWMSDAAIKYSLIAKYKDFSPEYIAELSQKIYADDSHSQEYKMCLRELITYFESPYSQQNYDAYIAQRADALAINEKDRDALLEMYQKTFEEIRKLQEL